MTACVLLLWQAIEEAQGPWRYGECDDSRTHGPEFSQHLLDQRAHELGGAPALRESGEQRVAGHLRPAPLHWLSHWAAGLQPGCPRGKVQRSSLCQRQDHARRCVGTSRAGRPTVTWETHADPGEALSPACLLYFPLYFLFIFSLSQIHWDKLTHNTV